MCDPVITPHCPKNNLNIPANTKPVMVGADVTAFLYIAQHTADGTDIHWKQKSDIYRCIRSSCDTTLFGCLKKKKNLESAEIAADFLSIDNRKWTLSF